jgi:hypothetical protein
MNHLVDEQVVIGVDPGKVAGWGVLSVSPEPRLLKRGQINAGDTDRAVALKLEASGTVDVFYYTVDGRPVRSFGKKELKTLVNLYNKFPERYK